VDVTYKGDDKDGRHGVQPVGAVGRQPRVAHGRVGVEGIVALPNDCHGDGVCMARVTT